MKYPVPQPDLQQDLLAAATARAAHADAWLREWSAGQLLAADDGDAAPDTRPGPAPFDPDATPNPFTTPAYDRSPAELQAGSIRLLCHRATGDPGRPLYVLILGEWTPGAVWFAPFSDYGAPATENELLSGLAPAPLQVLQVWNARSCPLELAGRGWFVMQAPEQLVPDAKAVYSRWLRADCRLPEDLCRRVGTMITSDNDPRIGYLNQEAARLGHLSSLAVKMEETDRRAVIIFPQEDFKRSAAAVPALAAAASRSGRLQTLAPTAGAGEPGLTAIGHADLIEGPLETDEGGVFARWEWVPGSGVDAWSYEACTVALMDAEGSECGRGLLRRLEESWEVQLNSGDILRLGRCDGSTHRLLFIP